MLWLLAEFAIVFILAPTLLAIKRFRAPLVFLLWILFTYCLVILHFKNQLLLLRLFPSDLLTFSSTTINILSVFFVTSLFLIFLVRRLWPHLLFNIIKKYPRLWIFLIVAYPILSVYPQGVIYRAFFFYRYQELFPNPDVLLFMSAVAFAYAHILLRNWTAIVATFIGGILFALRYAGTGSLFLSSFEHALYGLLMFGVGLGQSFYYGASFSRIHRKSLQ